VVKNAAFLPQPRKIIRLAQPKLLLHSVGQAFQLIFLT
jgi:hypothetical protein